MKSLARRMVRASALFVLLILWGGADVRAQYTDRQAIEDLGGPQEFAARRAELNAQTKTGYTLLFARNEIAETAHYREDNDFYYYTGVQDPGAVLAIDNASGKATLFEPQQVGRTAQVYGGNLLSQPEEAKRLGFAARSGPLCTHIIDPKACDPNTRTLSSTAPHVWRMPEGGPGHDLLQKVTSANRATCAIQQAARRPRSLPDSGSPKAENGR